MSPWLLMNYNTVFLSAKLGVGPKVDGDRALSIEMNSFRSFKGFTTFEHDGLMARLAFKVPVTHRYAFFPVVNYQYFWNDEHPYSLRPHPWNDDRYTLSLGTLHRFQIAPDWAIQVEAGVLGMNYRLPYAHVGLSVFWRHPYGYVQLGLSLSQRARVQAPPPRPSDPVGSMLWQEKYLDDPNSDYHVHLADEYGDELQPLAVWKYRRAFVHPEIQVQFEF